MTHMEKIKILYLEDSPRVREEMEAFLQSLYGNRVELYMAGDLLSFDEMLYEWGETYDKIIVDLGINRLTEISDEVYENFWTDKAGRQPELYQGIPMEGWDYYSRVMRTAPLTANRGKDILLLSGYAEIMGAQVSPNDLPAELEDRLLSKGDEAFERKLRVFLES